MLGSIEVKSEQFLTVSIALAVLGITLMRDETGFSKTHKIQRMLLRDWPDKKCDPSPGN